MPTPADLRQALERLEAEAPPAADTRVAVLRRIGSTGAADRTPRTHRTMGLIAVTVALIVALGTVVALNLNGEVARPAGPPSATELTWKFDIPNPPFGTQFVPVSIGPDRQTGQLWRTDLSAAFVLTVHEPGSFDPATDLQQPEPVTVTGQAGFSGRITGDQTGVASLVWPTPEGGWVQIDGFGVLNSPSSGEPAQVLAEQLAVAPSVQFGRFGSPRLPFRLGWVPSGLRVQTVESGAPRERIFGSVSFGDDGPATAGVGSVLVTRVGAGQATFADEIREYVGPDRTTLTIEGRPAVLGAAVGLDAQVLAVDVAGSAFLVFVGDSAAGRYPVDAMRRIVEEADVSVAMTYPDTWIPASEAIPD